MTLLTIGPTIGPIFFQLRPQPCVILLSVHAHTHTHTLLEEDDPWVGGCWQKTPRWAAQGIVPLRARGEKHATPSVTLVHSGLRFDTCTLSCAESYCLVFILTSLITGARPIIRRSEIENSSTVSGNTLPIQLSQNRRWVEVTFNPIIILR
jgi:hypothetical protein